MADRHEDMIGVVLYIVCCSEVYLHNPSGNCEIDVDIFLRMDLEHPLTRSAMSWLASTIHIGVGLGHGDLCRKIVRYEFVWIRFV